MLESCFLVSANLVLMAGMVFSSGGFTRGSTGYTLMTIAVAATILGSTGVFLVLLIFEIYRSVKFAHAHVLARQAEEEAVEEALRGRRRRSTVTGADGVARRPSTTANFLRSGSSLARRFSLAPTGGPSGSAANSQPGAESADMHGGMEAVEPTTCAGSGVPNPPTARRRASVTAQQHRGTSLLTLGSSEWTANPLKGLGCGDELGPPEAAQPSRPKGAPGEVVTLPWRSSPPPARPGQPSGAAGELKPQGPLRVPPPPPGPPRRPDAVAATPAAAALVPGRPVARSARVQAMTSSRFRLADPGQHSAPAIQP